MVSHRAVLPAQSGTRPMPSVTLTPGLRLRTEAGVALHDLGQGGEAVLRVVRDNLRGALAYTAAIGETSMIARGAEAVRLAIGRLDAGLVGPACVALTEALSCLSPALPPVPSEPAFSPSVAG